MAGETLLSKLQTVFNRSSPCYSHLVNANKHEIESSKRFRIHNWTTYIRGDILEMWGELSDEARFVAAIMAQEQADNEEWE